MDTLSPRTFAEWSLRAGWRLHHDAADIVHGALGGETGLARRTMRLVLTTVEESAAGAAILAPDDSTRAAWTECHNRVEAFRAFEHVDAVLGARVERCAIPELLERAARLRPPLSVWAAEGVGYHLTAERTRDRAWSRQPRPLCDTLPEWARIPFHAGVGSALAVHVLEAAAVPAQRRDMVDVLARFTDLCESASVDGCRDIALEALGFTARGMFGELAPALAGCAAATDSVLGALICHGAGRALYFAPTASLPLADTRRRVLDELIAGPWEDYDFANTIAGFSWAATLVNLRNPFVLVPYVTQAATLEIEREFGRGVHDALAAWRWCAPGDEARTAFAAYLPSDRSDRAAWTRMREAAPLRPVTDPAELFQVPPSRS